MALMPCRGMLHESESFVKAPLIIQHSEPIARLRIGQNHPDPIFCSYRDGFAIYEIIHDLGNVSRIEYACKQCHGSMFAAAIVPVRTVKRNNSIIA